MKRRAARITAIFFSAMLVLTFCSRTIYRSALVKVCTSLPAGGTLKYTLAVDEFDYRADAYLNEYIPFELEQPLTVVDAYAAPGDVVAVGDALVAFYAPEGEQLLAAAEAGLLSARAAYAEWQVALAQADAQLAQRLDQAQTSAERGLLNAQQELLRAGVLNGSSTREVYRTLERAQARLEYLERLAGDDWVMRASAAGTLCAGMVESGSQYAGISPICRIAPAQAGVFLEAGLSDAPDMRRGDWKATAYLETRDGLTEAEVLSCAAQGVRVGLPQSCAGIGVISVILKLESPYEQLLVPNRAVHDGSVYVLATDVGAWGQSVYSVRKVDVVTGNSDLQSTAIREGLDRSDRIITSATGALTDGQVVVLDDYG